MSECPTSCSSTRGAGTSNVAIGDPGVIEVFETTPLRRREVVATGRGAHTLAFDPSSEILYAFLPESHCAAVYREQP